MQQVREKYPVTERQACRILGHSRTTQRDQPILRDDEAPLTASVIRLAGQYGRYGYRRVTALLDAEGWHVNHKRVERVWRREGPKVPIKQPKRGRLWLNDGLCIRLGPRWRNHVWAYDFVQARTHDGRPFHRLTVIDGFTRECRAIEVARSLKHDDVLQVLLREAAVLSSPCSCHGAVYGVKKPDSGAGQLSEAAAVSHPVWFPSKWRLPGFGVSASGVTGPMRAAAKSRQRVV